MRRLVALGVASVLVASSTMVSSPHVHEYIGHDHPDHHHGPATHEHGPAAPARPDHHAVSLDDHRPAVEAESCDPGRHTVSLSTGCAWVSQGHVDLAELPGPAVAVVSGPIRSAVPVRDVRAHGPPLHAPTAPRAPPVNPHA